MSSGLNVYFGGSFDPPHLGHHEIVKNLLKDPWVEKLYVVPTFQNPLKTHQAASDRLEWVKVWLEQIKKEINFKDAQKLILDEYEIKNEKTSYTVDTLKVFREREPNAEWVLALGADNIDSFSRWKNIEELFSLLHSVWIFPRGEWNSQLDIEEPFKKMISFRVMLSQVPEVSSTEIREVLTSANASQKLAELPIPESVRKLLKEKF